MASPPVSKSPLLRLLFKSAITARGYFQDKKRGLEHPLASTKLTEYIGVHTVGYLIRNMAWLFGFWRAIGLYNSQESFHLVPVPLCKIQILAMSSHLNSWGFFLDKIREAFRELNVSYGEGGEEAADVSRFLKCRSCF